MSSITFTSDIIVEEVQQVGDDYTLCCAAWQSTQGVPAVASEERMFGLLRSLVRERHGGVHEHGFLTVSVRAPLFVLAQWTRHRNQALSADDLSFSVESARYCPMEPVFWVPRPDRPLIPAEGFKAMRPEFKAGSPGLYADVTNALGIGYETCWEQYQFLLGMGVANEVARAVLPQSTYCHWWASANPRSWLAFLSLRTKHPDALVVSHVQRETEEAARQVEEIMTKHWPLLMRAWQETGRGSP